MAYEAVPLNDTLAETVAMMQPQANRERVIIRPAASSCPTVADMRACADRNSTSRQCGALRRRAAR